MNCKRTNWQKFFSLKFLFYFVTFKVSILLSLRDCYDGGHSNKIRKLPILTQLFVCSIFTDVRVGPFYQIVTFVEWNHPNTYYPGVVFTGLVQSTFWLIELTRLVYRFDGSVKSLPWLPSTIPFSTNGFPSIPVFPYILHDTPVTLLSPSEG